MRYRYSPRGSSEPARRRSSSGVKDPRTEQGTTRRLDLAERRDHPGHGRTARTRLVVHLEAADFLDLQEQVVEEHRVGMQVDEGVGEVPGDLAIHRLETLPVQPGGERARGVLLQADDRPRRPELVLGVVVAAVKQGDAFPCLLGDLTEHVAAAPEQPSRLVGVFQQVKHASGMPAEQGGDVRRADEGAVAHRVAACRPPDQRPDEVEVLHEPRVPRVEADRLQLVPRQGALDAQDRAGQDAELGPQHAVQPGHGLGRTGPPQDVVLDDLALAKQPLLVVEERFRLDHPRRQNLAVLPRRARRELLQGEPSS